MIFNTFYGCWQRLRGAWLELLGTFNRRTNLKHFYFSLLMWTLLNVSTQTSSAKKHFLISGLFFDPTRTNTKHRLSTTDEAFDEFILFLPLSSGVENEKAVDASNTLIKGDKSLRCLMSRAHARKSHRRRLMWCRRTRQSLISCGAKAFGWSAKQARECFTIICYQRRRDLTRHKQKCPWNIQKNLRWELNEF